MRDSMELDKHANISLGRASCLVASNIMRQGLLVENDKLLARGIACVDSKCSMQINPLWVGSRGW